MDRLVLGVVGVAEGDIGQLVEAQLPVGLGIGDLLMQVGALQQENSALEEESRLLKTRGSQAKSAALMGDNK